MELIYLYIPAYRIFENFEINFTGRFRFHFEKTTRVLSFRENNEAICGSFFTTPEKNHPVKNVTAIMGNNGSGKTTIANFLCQMRVYNNLEYIIVWRSQNEFFHSSNIIPEMLSPGEYADLCKDFRSEENKIKPKNLPESCYSSDLKGHYKISRKSGDFQLFKHALSKLGKWTYPIKDRTCPNLIERPHFDSDFSFIYFSNYYSPLHTIEEINGTTDLSTTNLMIRDHENALNPHTGVEVHFNPISAHNMMEMVRGVEFFAEFNELGEKGKWEMPVPTGVRMEILDLDIRTLLGIIKKAEKQYGELGEILEKILATKRSVDISPTFISSKSKEIAIEEILCDFFKAFLGNFFRYHIDHFGVIPDLMRQVTDNIRDLINEIVPEKIEHFCKKMAVLEFQDSTVETYGQKIKEKHEVFTQFLLFMRDLKIQNDRFQGNGYYYDLKKTESFEQFKKILPFYFASNTITHYASFQWLPPISSGEIAQHNNFSRLFSKRKRLQDSNKKLLLFFDEIEITIHPDQQRKLISNVLKFLNLFFRDFSIHVLIASHSPILLSDIPCSQTVLLKREGMGVELIEKPTETFGSNIHTLYEDSFFLSELVGEFALEKIKALVEKIENLSENSDAQELRIIREEISVIGEPFLKHKINELFEEKLPTEKKRGKLEDEISFHEEKIAELKRDLRKIGSEK